MDPTVSIFTTTLASSAFDIFKYVLEKFGTQSEQTDKLMDIYNIIFSEEIASELQRRLELLKVQELATTLSPPVTSVSSTPPSSSS